jgi:hypothetical protein
LVLGYTMQFVSNELQGTHPAHAKGFELGTRLIHFY